MTRFAVNVWVVVNNNIDRLGDESVYDTYTEARDAARRRWAEHKGACRVTVFDEALGVVMWRLDPGPMPRDLPCHDPEHKPPPPPAGERRKKKRS